MVRKYQHTIYLDEQEEQTLQEDRGNLSVNQYIKKRLFVEGKIGEISHIEGGEDGHPLGAGPTPIRVVRRTLNKTFMSTEKRLPGDGATYSD